MGESRVLEGASQCAGPGPNGHALAGDRPQWPRDRVVDVRHIKLELSLDLPARSIAGTATHRVTPLNDGLETVSFDAVEMTIGGVAVDGDPAGFSHDGRSLEVELGAGRRRGTEIEIAITYRATPRLGLNFIGPDPEYPRKPLQVWSQSQDEDSRYWFPCYDYPNNKQTSEMAVTVPGSWFALSNGKLQAERVNPDGSRTFHWLQARPHSTYLITLAAGELTRIDASREDLAIDYYVEAADAERAQLTFGRTPEMIALFERLTGVPYPWAKYSQIVVRDFVFGGMENTSATTMTENILVDRKATRDFTSDDLVSHELAHMWWGDLLTCRDWSHGWLNEGFASYFELLWDEEYRGRDEYRQGVLLNTELYMDERYRRPIVSNVYHEPIDIFDRHLYEKGSLVLHMLRGVLGDDAFFRSIQRYCRENRDRNVVTQDLLEAVEAETGRNLEWFFEQWVHKPGHPELKVRWSWDARKNLANVNVQQTQATDSGTPIFRLPVTIDFATVQGRPKSFRVEITEKDQTFAFPLDRKPRICRFDPGNWVLKKLDFDKPLTELITQLREDDDIAGKHFAAEALAKKGGPEAIEALAEVLARAGFWSVRGAAAKALGAMRTPAARAVLLRSLGIRQHRVRRAVVAALGEFRGDAEVFAAIEPLSRKDPSWFVEAEANRTAGKLRAPGAFDLLRENMDRPSFRQVVRTGCVDGLVELRDERGFDLLLAATQYGAPWQSRAPAASALAKLALFFPERKKAIGEELANLVRDPFFRVRIAAAEALKTLGDPSFGATLDAMAARELDGRAIRAGREQAAALRRGAGTTDEVRRLREQFEALREENRDLRARVESLDAVQRRTSPSRPGVAKKGTTRSPSQRQKK